MLFIVASIYDEGLGMGLYQLIEAESKNEIIRHFYEHPEVWERYLERSYPDVRGKYYRQFQVSPDGRRTLLRILLEEQPTFAEFVEYCELTSVDGDSAARLDILPVPVTTLDSLKQTDPAAPPPETQFEPRSISVITTRIP
jgi:hypothetical protein